jgi:hypothetical protein
MKTTPPTEIPTMAANASGACSGGLERAAVKVGEEVSEPESAERVDVAEGWRD